MRKQWFGPWAAHAVRTVVAILFAAGLAFPQGAAPERCSLRLTFFGSSTCGECAEIREKMLEPLQAQNPAKLKIEFKDIENDVKLLSVMERDYKVANPAPQELFFPDTVLEGYDDIMRLGKSRIESYLATPDKWIYRHAYGDSTIDTVSTVQAIRQRLSNFTWIGLFAAGFVDGINPCAIATMIFLISFLGTQKRTRKDILKIGLTFSATVFVTYFSIGLGVFKLLSLMRNYWVSFAIRAVAVSVAVIVGIISIIDAIRYYRTKDTKTITDQLPKGVKMLIHGVIKGNLSSNKIVMGAIIAGFFVTLFEGVCTAKIYLPTIVLMTQHFAFRLLGWSLLVLYNLLFVTPLLLVLIFTAYGLKWNRLAKFTQDHLALMKVLLALVLFGLAAFISVGR